MKTIDDLISEAAQEEFAAKLGHVMDFDLWSLENRDSKIEELLKINGEASDFSVESLKELLSSDIDGKSVIYWRVKQQYLLLTVNGLITLRNQLDTISEDELSKLTIDYTWITAQIKYLYNEINRIEGLIESSDKDKAVEL